MDASQFGISLTVKNSVEALDFYTRAFGAVEYFRMPTPDGGTAHAEFGIGDTTIYISDESPDWGAQAMAADVTASCLFGIPSEDCDTDFAKALEAGATAISEPEDQFWGIRTGVVRDPFGYRWVFRQSVEDLSNEEIAQRAQALFGG